MLTTSCLMSGDAYSAEAVTETPVRAAVLPGAAFQDLMARSAAFRAFVFSAFGERMSGLLALIEEVAFGRIDTRLARLLLDRMGVDGHITVTHQDLAVELGTAREVVSRQLKDFERRGLVALERGRLVIRDPRGLRPVAERAAG